MYTKERLSKYPYFEEVFRSGDASNVVDSLTGLVSRKYMIGFIQHLIENGVPFTLALLDLDTNTLYTQNDLDMNYFGDFSCPEHALAAVMSGYESILQYGQEFIWSQEEILTSVSEADIAAVNAALNP